VYPSPLTGTLGLDLILFRNVAIYLKPEVTRAIIQRFHQALRPGGWLLLGETEVSAIPTEGFTPRRFEHATLHQKTSDSNGLNTTSAMATRPVLADVGDVRHVSIPNVPSLPEWVPLPTRRENRSEPGELNGQELTHSTEPPIAQLSAWERMARCLTQRDFAGAETIIDRLAAKSDRSEMRLRYVRALMSSAEITLARQALDTCLKEEPLSIEAQLLKASFAEEAGALDIAEQACRRALYIDRNCTMAHFHLALVQQQKGDLPGARRSLQTTLKLIEVRESHELVTFGEGVCYGRLREMISLLL